MEGEAMKLQEAIRILMLSPCYWLLAVKERRVLVNEFIASYAVIGQKAKQPSKKEK
jgi:hypothetical protein